MCLLKSKIEMTFVGFNDSKGIFHKEFMPRCDHTVTYKYYLNVYGPFVEGNAEKQGISFSLHDSGHPLTGVRRFLAKNECVPI